MAQTKPCPESQAAVKLLTQGCLVTPRSAVPGAPGAVGSVGDPPGEGVSTLFHTRMQTGKAVVVHLEEMPSGWRPSPATVRPGMGGGGACRTSVLAGLCPHPTCGPPRLCPDSTPLRRLCFPGGKGE